ncbi:MAG: amidohydrolase family protein, partial [Gammaproteobacteria bacterium]|nr:amidohydrolase family protein [Gammaproteobacteria bacterium]
MTIRHLLIAGLLMITACGDSNQTSGPVAADAVYVNAKVYTVDSDNSWASALAVTDGKIVAVGNDEDVMAHAGDATTVVDLDGRMMMPGIHDTHIHAAIAGVQKQLQCNFQSFDINEVLEILKTCIAETPEGKWVRGGQWYEVLFASGETPKAILDEIAPNHPVFL